MDGKEGWPEDWRRKRSSLPGRECGCEANTGVVVALGRRLKNDRLPNKHSVTEYSNANQRHNYPSRRFAPASLSW